MQGRLSGSFVFCLLFLTITADAFAAPSEGRPVKFPNGDRQILGTLFEPPGEGPFPALVEVHGVSGQESWDLEASQRFAEAGYVTLSVDLFGRLPRDYKDGLRLRDRAHPYVVEDLRAAMRYLRTFKNVSPDRIGSIGWCMGGKYTLLLAVVEPTLAAGVMIHGHVLVQDPAELGKIQAPILALFGAEDRSIPIPGAKMFGNTMRELGKHIELHIYPDAVHGFGDPTSSNYHPEAGPDSWKRTIAFLKANLAERKGVQTSRIAR